MLQNIHDQEDTRRRGLARSCNSVKNQIGMLPELILFRSFSKRDVTPADFTQQVNQTIKQDLTPS